MRQSDDGSSIHIIEYDRPSNGYLYELISTYSVSIVKKIDVDRIKKREKKNEKRTDEPQRCITHHVVDLLFFIFIFFCSFPHFSFPGFFFSLSLFSLYMCRDSSSKKKESSSSFFFLLLSTLLMIVGGRW